jgi:hypothetical protein
VCGTTWGSAEEVLVVHGYEKRQWRHLDTMPCETIIAARVPRVRHEDGHTEMVRVPWARERSRWTLIFEEFAIRVLAHCRSVSRGCALLRLDWSSAQHLMEAAVQRGVERREVAGLRQVGMDEKSFRRGEDYISVPVDLKAVAPQGNRIEKMGGRRWRWRDTLRRVPDFTLRRVPDFRGRRRCGAGARPRLHATSGSPIHRPPRFHGATSALWIWDTTKRVPPGGHDGACPSRVPFRADDFDAIALLAAASASWRRDTRRRRPR